MSRLIGTVTLFLLLLFNGLSVLAESTHVNVRDVFIDSPANHIVDGKMYVDVSAFSRMVNIPYQINEDQSTVRINGKTMELRKINGIPTAHIRKLADAVGAGSVTWDSESRVAYVHEIPESAFHSSISNEKSLVGMISDKITQEEKGTELLKSAFFITSFVFFIFLTKGILLSIYKAKFQIEQRIFTFITNTKKELIESTSNEQRKSKKDSKFRERVVLPLVEKLRKDIVEKMSVRSIKRLEETLRESGNYQLSAVDFRILQGTWGFMLFFMSLVLFLPESASPGRSIVTAIIFGVLGASIPNLLLKLKKKKRIEWIQRDMPNFFDMVNVAVEAGMGLDQALARVSQKMGGPISEEFIRALDDMKLGKSRRAALSETRNRVHSELFQSVVGAMIQADQLGIGMSKVLRAQTKRIREKQRETAREKAMKVPVKLIFPMAFFIFPCIFIIILGPLVIKFLTGGFHF